MKSLSIRRVQLTKSLQIVVIVRALGRLLLPSVTLAHYIDPACILDDGGKPTYSIVCNNTCTVHNIKPDGVITSYRISGPLSSAELRRRYRVCVDERQQKLVTYEMTNKGRGFFGMNTVKIGTPYCI